VDSFQANASNVLGNYMDSRSASSEKRQRIDLLDLKDQREGEAHIFFKSKIIRATMFFANPTPAEKMRINQFLKVEPPLNRVLAELDVRIKTITELAQNESIFASETLEESEEIASIASAMTANLEMNPIERSLQALMSFQEHVTGEAAATAVEEEPVEPGRLTIFAQVQVDPLVETLVGAAQLPEFAKPIMNKSYAKDKLSYIERLLGRSSAQANAMVSDVINDLTSVTDYPPDVSTMLLPTEEVVARTQELCDYVKSLVEKSETQET
jgi:intracellular multiplication protein IcmO